MATQKNQSQTIIVEANCPPPSQDGNIQGTLQVVPAMLSSDGAVRQVKSQNGGIPVQLMTNSAQPLIISIPGGIAQGGSAGGDLAGSYPNPTISTISHASEFGNIILTTTSATGDVTGFFSSLQAVSVSHVSAGVLASANGGTAVTTGLTALDASNLTSGTVAQARLPATNVSYATITADTSTSSNTQATTNLSASISLRDSSSRVKITVCSSCFSISNGANDFIVIIVKRDGTAIAGGKAVGVVYLSANTYAVGNSFTVIDSPAGGGNHTYEVFFRNDTNSNVVYFLLTTNSPETGEARLILEEILG